VMVPIGSSKENNLTALAISRFNDQMTYPKVQAGSVHSLLPIVITGLSPESLLNGLSLPPISGKKAAIGDDPSTVAQIPTSNESQRATTPFP